jgi:hypothetical protein
MRRCPPRVDSSCGTTHVFCPIESEGWPDRGENRGISRSGRLGARLCVDVHGAAQGGRPHQFPWGWELEVAGVRAFWSGDHHNIFVFAQVLRGAMISGSRSQPAVVGCGPPATTARLPAGHRHRSVINVTR